MAVKEFIHGVQNAKWASIYRLPLCCSNKVKKMRNTNSPALIALTRATNTTQLGLKAVEVRGSNLFDVKSLVAVITLERPDALVQ